MKSHSKFTEFNITSNLVYLIPLTTAIISRELIFTVLLVLTCCISPLYHYYRHTKPASSKAKKARIADWLTSLSLVVYSLHYIGATHRHPHDAWLSVAGILLIGYFFYGLFHKSRYNSLHPWWHIGGAILLTVIIVS